MADQIYQYRHRKEAELWMDCAADEYATFAQRPEIERRIVYSAPAPAASPADQGEDARWIPVSERLPSVAVGKDQEFIVACRRAHNGKTYVFAACWLNAKNLWFEMEDQERSVTGWHYERADDGDSDTAWWPVCSEGDEVTHWMELPGAPAIDAAMSATPPAGEKA